MGPRRRVAKSAPFAQDLRAVKIVAALDYDFVALARALNQIALRGWIARCLHFDRALRSFLEVHPEATIVNLGCGLDTAFERVDNGRLQWFDVDLPDVIALRRRVIPEGERRRLVTGSLLEDAWRKEIAPRDAVFFLAAGVLYYFSEVEVRALLSGLAGEFPGAELIFDACSPLGRRMANKNVIAATGMQRSAYLRWGLRRAKDLETFDPRISAVEAYPMFRGVRRGLSFGDWMGTLLSDAFNIMSIVRLRFQR